MTKTANFNKIVYENCEKSQSYEKKLKCDLREVLAKTVNFMKIILANSHTVEPLY